MSNDGRAGKKRIVMVFHEIAKPIGLVLKSKKSLGFYGLDFIDYLYDSTRAMTKVNGFVGTLSAEALSFYQMRKRR